jgi:hypothetical protein
MANKMREWAASERKSAQTSAKAWQDFFVKGGGAAQQTEGHLEQYPRSTISA